MVVVAGGATAIGFVFLVALGARIPGHGLKLAGELAGIEFAWTEEVEVAPFVFKLVAEGAGFFLGNDEVRGVVEFGEGPIGILCFDPPVDRLLLKRAFVDTMTFEATIIRCQLLAQVVKTP